MYPLRLVLCFWWFFGACAVLCAMALLPRFRFEILPIYARRIAPVALRILGIHMEIRHAERLDSSRPCVFVPNHQHLFDVFIIGALFKPKTIAVGKLSLKWIPFFGWLFRRTGNLFIDRGVNEKAVATMRDAHRRIVSLGLSVVIAPEGTRSGKSGLLPFKKGPFHLAVGTELPLQPIVISSLHKTLDYWKLKSGTILVDLLEPIPTKGIARDDIPQLIEKTRATMQAAIAALDAELATAP